MHTSLVIMAAGLGSRFGTGIKQLEPVGLHDEIIMDYSIHDAIQAGFDQIIFIIRKDIEEDFKERIGNRIEEVVKDKEIAIHYCFQALEDLPAGFTCPSTRTKPWGTGQAVLAAKDFIDGPFCVINADDYYGKEAYREAYRYLTADKEKTGLHACMVGFILKNTLSENGGVTRGICRVNEDRMLADIEETHNIVKTADGAEVQEEGSSRKIDVESEVSMNMWGLTPEFLNVLETGFEEFLERLEENDQKKEYLLPTIIGGLLKEGRIQVEVLQSADRWFGVTYKEDKEDVIREIKKLIESGAYCKIC